MQAPRFTHRDATGRIQLGMTARRNQRLRDTGLRHAKRFRRRSAFFGSSLAEEHLEEAERNRRRRCARRASRTGLAVRVAASAKQGGERVLTAGGFESIVLDSRRQRQRLADFAQRSGSRPSPLAACFRALQGCLSRRRASPSRMPSPTLSRDSLGRSVAHAFSVTP